MSDRKEEWRDIPGYNGWYQISDWGRIRTWRANGARDARLKEPKIIKANITQRLATVCLTADDANRKRRGVMRLMAEVWLGGLPPGMRTIHKDGNIENNSRWNIQIVSSKAAHKVSAKAANADRRQPVVIVGDTLEIIDAYTSAREAGRRTGLDRSNVVRRCNLKCTSVFALNGLIYAWDDDHWIEKTLRRAMAELDAMGVRYNTPHTEQYYNLQPETGYDLDLAELQWANVPALAGVQEGVMR